MDKKILKCIKKITKYECENHCVDCRLSYFDTQGGIHVRKCIASILRVNLL